MRALLALLALQPDLHADPDRILDSLWGEDLPGNPANALQIVASRLRAALAPHCRVIATHPGYRLELPPDAVDAHRFNQLTREGRALRRAGDLAAAARAFDAALSLWSGTAMEDLLDIPVLAQHAASLNEQRLDALETLAEINLGLGRAGELIGVLLREIHSNPLRESLGAHLIRALAATGRPTQAHAVYDDIRRRLESEFGAAPGLLLQSAHDDIASRATASDIEPTLPKRLTSLVGRDADLERVCAMLTSVPVLTLTGPGGAGKTSLAIEAATRSTTTQPTTCRFVELAAVTIGDTVADVIIAALTTVDHNRAQLPPPQRLAAALDGVELLVLDNCEHLPELGELISGVLEHRPTLRVLATSREPVGVSGETLYAVAPLPVPAPGADLAETAKSPALALFVERAQAVRPTFALTADNYAPLGEICRQLDGLPLALELAAARVIALSPQELAAHLDDQMLAHGHRRGTARHRTLHAVVAWSWELLTDPQRDLAQQLSMFVGGTDLDTLEQVCGGPVTDELTALVNKSLVSVEAGRYRMLETIRAFAQHSLAPPRYNELAGRCADHLIGLVEAGEAGLRTPSREVWAQRFAVDHVNIAAALDWAVDNGEAERAILLCGNTMWYWMVHGHRSEALSWRRRVLALAPTPPPGVGAAYLHCAYADQWPDYGDQTWWGTFADATGRFSALVAAAMSERRQPHPVFVLVRAVREAQAGNWTALDRCVESTDAWLSINAVARRGLQRLAAADHSPGVADLEAAVELGRSLEPRTLPRSRLILATHRIIADGPAAAAPLLAQAFSGSTPWLSANAQVTLHTWAAQLHAWVGDIDSATPHIERAHELLAPAVLAGTHARVHIVRAEILRHAGDLDAATALYRSTLPALAGIRRRLGRPEGYNARAAELWGRSGYAMLLLRRGELDAARAELEVSEDLLHGDGDLDLRLTLATARAHIELAAGQHERALATIGACDLLHTGRPDGHRTPDARYVIDTTRASLGEHVTDRILDHAHRASDGSPINLLAT
ncbi:BTAD domain-containing putative transcriptional regulator [Nocardia heshunensis]